MNDTAYIGSRRTPCDGSSPNISPIRPIRPISKNTAFHRATRHLTRARRETQPPPITSFADFLANHARVKSGSG